MTDDIQEIQDQVEKALVCFDKYLHKNPMDSKSLLMFITHVSAQYVKFYAEKTQTDTSVVLNALIETIRISVTSVVERDKYTSIH